MMPKLLSSIKHRLKEAASRDDRLEKCILGVVMGQIESKKFSMEHQGKEFSDDDAIKVIKFLIKSTKKAKRYCLSETGVKRLVEEIEIMQSLLPKKIWEEEDIKALLCHNAIWNEVLGAKRDYKAMRKLVDFLKKENENYEIDLKLLAKIVLEIRQFYC